MKHDAAGSSAVTVESSSCVGLSCVRRRAARQRRHSNGAGGRVDAARIGDAGAVTAPTAKRARRRAGHRGADRWSDWWLIGGFALWTVVAAADRDWSSALTPAICFVGFALQVLLKVMRRPTAATVVVVVTVGCVFVVSLLQQAWFVAVVTGVGLLAMAGVWLVDVRPNTWARRRRCRSRGRTSG
ncbi:hypothetical protein GTR02_15610 [Kineococcus sp. R8]|uniref:hypothetical protein n=1 Tax=Kineococcus siccus TaxID=2696567 RepID=UPI001411ECFC|nr:hypothetical protein [Kineococcus siccus]NAZ83246.1 hypothetical protein [Kineococcus siccus]